VDWRYSLIFESDKEKGPGLLHREVVEFIAARRFIGFYHRKLHKSEILKVNVRKLLISSGEELQDG